MSATPLNPIQDRIDALNTHVEAECIAIARLLLDTGDSECVTAAGEILIDSGRMFLANYEFADDGAISM